MIGHDTMTALSDKILDTLRANGGWLSRRQLARELGRPTQLSPYDTDLLENLVSAGLVERETRLMGVVKTIWYYRAK